MNETITKTVGLAMLAALAWTAPGQASPWLMPSGAAEHFTYANGQDLNGFFGEPVVSGDTFTFPSFHFVATAQNGSSLSRSDTISVDLIANPGWTFGLMRVGAFGDYETSGSLDQNQVGIVAVLSFDETEPPGRHWESALVTTPAFPSDTSQGVWSGLAVIDLGAVEPLAGGRLHLEYSHGLIAVSGPGGSARIHCHGEGPGGFELAIGMAPVPEPGTLALLTCGAMLVGSRSRRMHGSPW
jgi:hypothetical protein